MNACGLLQRLMGKQNEELSESWPGCTFKWATSALCIALLALDLTWTRWVLRNMLKIAKGLWRQRTTRSVNKIM